MAAQKKTSSKEEEEEVVETLVLLCSIIVVLMECQYINKSGKLINLWSEPSCRLTMSPEQREQHNQRSNVAGFQDKPASPLGTVSLVSVFTLTTNQDTIIKHSEDQSR